MKTEDLEEKFFWPNKNGEQLLIKETGFNYKDYFTFTN